MPEVLAFLVGALAFSVAEALWLLVRLMTGDDSKWTLEPTAGLLLAGATILVGMVWFGAQRGAGRAHFVAEPFMAYAGTCVSLTVWMFIIGPSNLWPIVLWIDYILVAPVVFVGWILGRAVARRITTR